MLSYKSKDKDTVRLHQDMHDKFRSYKYFLQEIYLSGDPVETVYLVLNLNLFASEREW